MARKRVGDLLYEMGMITAEQLEYVLETQRNTKERLGELLIRTGLITEEQMIEVLEFQLGIPHVNLYRFQLDASIVQLIPETLARRHLVIAVKKEKNKLTVAMADPLDYYAIDDLRMSTGFAIEPAIAVKEDLRVFIDRYYGMRESVDELKAFVPREEELDAQITDEDSPIVRLVNQIIHQALQQRASDIHIDPTQDGVSIRYRIDGVLRTEQILPKYMQSIVVSRIKIMANLDISEKRLPQDGRMQLDLAFRQVDIRVSTLPTVHGETCVLRLFDYGNAFLQIDRLNLSEYNLKQFHTLLRSSNGIILITGPTGSGKTSTLYAALNALRDETRSIVTIEDPVEYQLAGMNQVQVNTVAGLTFARGLRAVLRQDPDIVMVGEIRDTETAEIAIRAALTGHMVLSTLHTNDAVSTVTRLMDMGVEPFLVASAIAGVVSQRLLRRVCEHCAEADRPSEAEAKLLHERQYPVDGLRRGRGCGYCNKTGFRGRIAIHELLRLDDAFRQMVLGKQSDADYRVYVHSQGFTNMLDDGLHKAAQGLTTLSEVLRVTMPE